MNQGATAEINKGAFAKASDLSKSALGLCCALVLLGMMSLTGADVIARYLFNAPIKGAFELIEILMVVFVYMAFPLAILANANVEVELWEPTSNRANQFRFALAALCGMVMFAVFTVQLFDHVQKYTSRESVTNSLGIPLSYVAMVAMIGSAMCIIFNLTNAIDRMRSK